MLIRYIIVLKLAFHSIAELIPFKVGLLLDSNDEAESNAIKRLADFTISTMYWTLQLEVQYHDQTYLSMMGGVCSLIDQDVAAIISASDSSSTAIQSNLIGQFQIPFIAAVATNPFMETPYVNNMELRLSPTDVHQSEAVYALLKEFLWFDFSILASSDSFGIRSTVRLQYLASQDIEFHIKDIQNFDTKRDLSQPSDVKVFSKELEVIKDSLVRVIVLSCHGRFAKRIFSEAKEMGLMAKDYIWITLDGVTARPDTLTHGDRSYLSYYKGIFGTTPHYGKDSGEYSDLKDAYVLNGGLSTDLTRASVKVSEGLKLIHFSLVRLGDIERETLKEVRCGKLNTWGAGQQLYSNMKKDFSGRQISSITGIEHFPTYEIMNFKSDGFERVGFWTYETGLLDSVGQKVKWRSRKDLTFIGSDTHPPTGLGSLEGYHLRIGIVEYPPTTYFVNSLECEKDPSRPRCWYGWSPEIFTRLAEDLKFTYEYAVAPTKMVGGTSESDSWSGSGTLMGDIIDRKTDITIPISMTYNRAKHVDFTAPLHEDSAALAMHPAIGSFASSANIFFFLDPFEMSVWGTILLLIFGIAILTNFFSKFSPLGTYGEKLHAMKTCPCKKCVLRRRVKKVVKCQVDEGEEDDGMNDLSIYNSNWLIAAGFVLQGVDVLPTSPSGRILLLTWWLFIMIISAMYTANLTASLTVESAVKTINNFNELLSQEYYEWGALEGDLLSSQLKNSTEEEHRDIYTRGKMIITTDVAAKKVKEGRFVFVGPRTLLEFVLKDDCEKIVVDTASYQNQWAFAVPFHAPYLKPINKMFITYTEEGYFTQGFERWKSGEEGGETCPVESDEIGSDTTFTPQLLAGLFIILAGAVGCSLTICCLEFLFVAYLDSRKGKGFCECLGTRIYLKKCEVMEEWFGLDRGKSAKNNIIFYNPDGTDDKPIEVPHSSGSNRSPYHYANSNGGMISHRALTTQDRPFTEEGNFILKQKDAYA